MMSFGGGGGAGGGLSGLTTDRLLFAGSATTAVDYAGLNYDADYPTGITESIAGTNTRVSLALYNVGLHSDVTRTHTSGTFANMTSNVIYTPGAGGAAPGAAQDCTVLKAKLEITGTNVMRYGTGFDCYVSLSGSQAYSALVAGSFICETSSTAAATGAVGITAATFTAVQSKADATTPTVVCVNINGNDDGGRVLRGTVNGTGDTGGYKGINIINLKADTATITERAAVYVGLMAGSASSIDAGLRILCTQASRIVGKLALGGDFAPSYGISFVKEVAATIGIEASAGGAVGAALTVSAGNASTSTTNNRSGGSLTLACGTPTGTSTGTTVSVITYISTGMVSGTTAQTPIVAQTWGTNGLVTTMGGAACVAGGMKIIRGSGRVAGTADARAAAYATYTVGSVDATFEVSGNVQINTVTTCSFSLDCVYTDQTNASRTLILPVTQLGGAWATGGLITNVTGTGPYHAAPVTIRCKAGTTITIRPSAGGTYTTVNYDGDGCIAQVAVA